MAQHGTSFVVALRSECARQPRYRVARLSLALDTLWRGTVECPRVAVPAGFIDSVVVVNRNRALSSPPGKQITASYAETQIRPKLGVVTAFTPARAMMVGNDGSIWIRPMRAVADSLEYWVRADPKAGSPGDFELPPRARLVYVADASRIWVMQLDADDLPTLTRYRIALPSGDR